MSWYEPLIDRRLLPDAVIRYGIRRKLKAKLRAESGGGSDAVAQRRSRLMEALSASPIATHTEAAKKQHYNVPPRFYEMVLGPHLKYSCGYWGEGAESLDQSERDMLELTCQRADIQDGQVILDLGCGWGSFSLYVARKYPNAQVTAVSHAEEQRAFIESKAGAQGLKNVRVITADVNQFDTDQRFDRIVSVEMFEHIRNYKSVLQKIARWIKEDGLLFVHVFSHKTFAYLYDHENDNDWIGKYFFTGGVMPARDLFHSFSDDFGVVKEWHLNGRHYQKTCEAWLRQMDEKQEAIMRLFTEHYRADALRMFARWRVFFMACAELFGFADGEEWGVSHYVFKPQAVPTRQRASESARLVS